MGIIEQSGHIVNKKLLNHTGTAGDIIKILYTPNDQNEIVILEYVIDENKRTKFKFELEEFTES